MDAPSRPHTKEKPTDVGSVADFVDLVNRTVGKHFKCCICFSIFSDPVMLPCNHALCRGCAKQSLQQHQRCPLCLATVPNLRTLQGRSKWITEMVDSLRNCLNEVGASLTQHAPVPPQYRNTRPPAPGPRRARRRASDTNRIRPPPPPSPPSCGCGGGSGSGEVSRAGTGRASDRSRPAPSPSRQAAAHPPPPPEPRSYPGDRGRVEYDAVSFLSTSPWLQSGRAVDDGPLREVHAPQPGDDEGRGVMHFSRVAPPSSDVAGLAPDPTPPVPARPFVVGDLVFVDPRTWPGMNKHGGVAIVAAVLEPPGSRYDVKYSVGQTVDRGVEASFVHTYSFAESSVGNRSRRRSSGGSSRPRRDTAGGRGGGGSVSPWARSRPVVADATAAAAAAAAARGRSPARTSSPWKSSRHGRPLAAAAEDEAGDTNAGVGEREAKQGGDARRSDAHVSRHEEDQVGAEEVFDSDATMSLESRAEEESDMEMEESDGPDGSNFNGEITEEELGREGVEAMDEGDLVEEGSGRLPPEEEDGKDEEKPAHEETAEVNDAVGSSAAASGVEMAAESRLGSSLENLCLRSTTAVTDDVRHTVWRRRHDQPSSGGEVGGTTPPYEASQDKGNASPVGRSSKKEGAEIIDKKAATPPPPPPPPRETPQDRRNARPVGRGSIQEGAEIIDKNAATPFTCLGSSDDVGRHHVEAGVGARSTAEAAVSLLSLSRRHSCDAVGDDRASTETVRPAWADKCPERDPAAGSARSGLSSTEGDRRDDARGAGAGSSWAPVTRPVQGQQVRPSPRPAELVAQEAQQRSPQQVIPPPPPLAPPPPTPTSSRTSSFSRTATPFSTPCATPAAASSAYKVGDLVDVLSRSSPGVNKEGGVARVTRVGPDGTYDVKYCVRQGWEKGVVAAIISRYTLGGDGSDSVAVSGAGAGAGSYSGGRDAGNDKASSAGKAAAGFGLVRRNHRTSRGACPPDAAAGQANAACLSVLLGDTQHPELDMDPDLGEDLDPDEGSPEGAAQTRREPPAAAAGMEGWMTRERGKGKGGGGKSGGKVDGKSTGEVQGRDDTGEKGRSASNGDGVERRQKEGVGGEGPRPVGGVSSACAPSEEDTAPAAVDHGRAPSRGRGNARAAPKKRGRSPRAAARPDAAQRKQARGGGSAVTRRGRPTGVVLTLSGLTPEMTSVAKALARSHGWRVEPKYTEAVTHVVCGAAAQTNKANIRSAKFLRAVASGKWVVNGSWLQECKLRGAQVKEDAFEVSGDKKSAVPAAPRRSRLAHAEPNRPGLFHGTTFHFRGEFGTESPPRSELEPMLLANGGTVVETIGSLFAVQPVGDGSSGGNGGADGGIGGAHDDVGSRSSSGGGWTPRRVVIFQPCVSSPDEDASALARELGDRLARPGSSPGSPESGDGGGGSGGSGGGMARGGRGGGVATAEVVRPLWLVDSVGSFRVLNPTEVHRVSLPGVSGRTVVEV